MSKNVGLLTADELLTTDWPEPPWAIKGKLPVGLALVAGRPKVGKSWLQLQLAHAVAGGGTMFGERIEVGPVLYLALEDPPRRLADRMRRQGWKTGLQADFICLGQFPTQIGNLLSGGAERLARQIEARAYRLVVIDTLSRAIAGDQNDVQAMTKSLTPIHEVAHSQSCTVLMSDHHNKAATGDVITDILGSTAKGGVCDTAWGLYRERGKAGARLAIAGRDVEEQTLTLTWDAPSGCWQYDGTSHAMLTDARQTLVDALSDLGSCRLLALADAVGRNKGSVYKDLQELIAAGFVVKTGDQYECV